MKLNATCGRCRERLETDSPRKLSAFIHRHSESCYRRDEHQEVEE